MTYYVLMQKTTHSRYTAIWMKYDQFILLRELTGTDNSTSDVLHSEQ